MTTCGAWGALVDHLWCMGALDDYLWCVGGGGAALWWHCRSSSGGVRGRGKEVAVQIVHLAYHLPAPPSAGSACMCRMTT